MLITKKVYVNEICFGGINELQKAISYAKTINIKEIYDCYIEYAISIKMNDGNFKKIWVFNQNFYWGNDMYAEWSGKVELDDAVFKVKNQLNKGITITYKVKDADGFKMNILNFVRNHNYWTLLKREKINTLHNNNNDINNERMGYCLDTINENCETKFNDSKLIFITNEMMFELLNTKCY